jgi:ABC-type branched-subunit amino acid transport system ATPase component
MRTSDIAVSGLRKAFGDKVVLDGIDFDVAAGSVFSMLGPNGAGKTTTVSVLTTLLRADAGTVRVGGHDVATETKEVRAATTRSGLSARAISSPRSRAPGTPARPPSSVRTSSGPSIRICTR